MSRRVSRWSTSITLAAVALAAVGRAGAQTKVQGFALDRFDPSVPVDAFFGVGSPAVGGHLIPRAAVVFDYGGNTLKADVPGKGATAVVTGQGVLHAGLSLPIWDRLLVSIDVPIAVVDQGTDPRVAGLTYHVPTGAAMGDIRIGLRGRIFGSYHDAFQVGIGGAAFLPSGSTDSYTSRGSGRATADLLLGGRVPGNVGFVWSASGGALLQGAIVAPLVRYGFGAAVVLEQIGLQIGPELYGSTPIGTPAPVANVVGLANTTASELELLGGAKLRIGRGLFVGAAAGAGLGAAVGSPDVRIVGSLGWAPPPAEKAVGNGDRDGDQIPDAVDACPDVPGVRQSDPAKDGCPIADRDHDGVLDDDDACPDVPGPKNLDATKNGCPVDTDEDGIPDSEDACPTVKGPRNSNPKLNGCPADRDGDRIPDNLDACPDLPGLPSTDPRINGCPEDPDGDGIKGSADACPFEKGGPDPDPAKNGCPKFVRVTSSELTISAKIQFKTNGYRRRDTVSPLSEDLMREIRDAIVQHPEIQRIEVQGHTDDEGPDEYNQKLSQDRAEAVRDWLVEAGIPANKLVAKGYGFTRPLADNRIRTGRDVNRRVQFMILERR